MHDSQSSLCKQTLQEAAADAPHVAALVAQCPKSISSSAALGMPLQGWQGWQVSWGHYHESGITNGNA